MGGGGRRGAARAHRGGVRWRAQTGARASGGQRTTFIELCHGAEALPGQPPRKTPGGPRVRPSTCVTRRLSEVKTPAPTASPAQWVRTLSSVLLPRNRGSAPLPPAQARWARGSEHRLRAAESAWGGGTAGRERTRSKQTRSWERRLVGSAVGMSNQFFNRYTDAKGRYF